MSSENPNRAALLATQQAALLSLLREVPERNPFYKQKLSAFRCPHGPIGCEALLDLLPFTTKAEVEADQQQNPPWGTNLGEPIENYTHFHQTSGTSGTPLRWIDTPSDWNAMVRSWTRVFTHAGVGPADRILFAFSFGPFLGFWLAFDAGQRLGALCIPTGGLNTNARLRLLIETGATVLCCTPTYACHLASAAARDRIDLTSSRVRLLMVAGEPGGSILATREHISRSWNGARVFDHHGMTEVGPVTYECPAQPGVLHVMEDAHLAEIVEPGGRTPVEDGQTGELILTTLLRRSAPLIRYRTGDLVRPRHAPFGNRSPACSCGSVELALEGGIISRVDDMAIVRGVNVYPSALDAIIRRCGGIAEYNTVLDVSDPLSELSLTIEVEPSSDDPERVRVRLEDLLRETLCLRIPVHVVTHGRLPRFEMKARRWIRK